MRALDDLVELRGALQRLRPNNGREFISAAQRQWAQRHGIGLLHIQPGKPNQNATIECFDRAFRPKDLDRQVFTGLHEVRRMTEEWRQPYNLQRSHRTLGRILPAAYAIASSQARGKVGTAFSAGQRIRGSAVPRDVDSTLRTPLHAAEPESVACWFAGSNGSDA